MKGKGERERLNAEFKKIARRNKKAFFNEQCKEIEENDRMGKTRDLFKKIRDTKGGGSEVKASAWNAGDPGSIPGLGRSPGEGRATHSSTLVYKIPWTEEPGRLQSMGLQRVRHD